MKERSAEELEKTNTVEKIVCVGQGGDSRRRVVAIGRIWGAAAMKMQRQMLYEKSRGENEAQKRTTRWQEGSRHGMATLLIRM